MADTPALSAAVADRYHVEHEIGRGGMAVVYLADDLRHHRKVAIKLLHPDLAQAVGPTRFLREITIAAQLTHPHIVPLYDSGELDGRLFYVMPYLEGESLRQKLDRVKQLPVDEALSITRQVSSALEYAHARNVVHRDIKPENILLYQGEAMVADFGIALAVSAASGPRLTGTGLVVGTPEYMSPEQALDEGTDGRSDQYSLACVLFEMLAGEPPYGGMSPHSILAKRLMDQVPSVRRLRGTVPAAVDAALTRALAKLPVDRFRTVADFAVALSAPAPTSDRAGCPSVAVLPFRNLSTDPENEFFADGITEDVIAHLSKIRALKVISRSSVMPFKLRQQSLREIGATLGATTLLDGSVRRAGDRVRIVAQLIDGESDAHLWTETYDRQLTDIFAIQTDVALHIADALEAELSHDEQSRVQREPTKNLEAYQLFLHGRQWLVRFTPSALERAIEQFERVVALDPGFALAWTSMAMAFSELVEHGAIDPGLAHRRASEAVTHALRIDPDLAAAYTVRGHLKMMHELDWEGAESDYKRALELSPSDADAYDFYGRLCDALERFDEAVFMHQRAHELDPLTHRSDLATTYIRAGRYGEALASARDAVAIDPGYARAWATLGWAQIFSGLREEGLASIEHAAQLTPENTLWLGQVGAAFAMSGQEARAREILNDLEKRAASGYVSPYHLAYVYTALGDVERAIDLVESAVASRTGSAYALKGSFLFRSLHGHPRFQALLRRMKLA
jgi:serine/threonine protein kinase/tetratricopeptide (TPR) repeat protein